MDKIALLQALSNYFNLEELRTLCFHLNVDFESLGGEGKQAKARELVSYCERHGRREELIAEVHRLRPNLVLKAQPDSISALEVLSRMFDNYQRLPGSHKNAALNRVVSQVLDIAHEELFDATSIRTLFTRGNAGNRLASLVVLRVYPFAECLDLVLEAISDPVSPFEQYQAMLALQDMLPDLNDSALQDVRRALLEQSKKYLIPANQGRWELYTVIMNKLEQRNLP